MSERSKPTMTWDDSAVAVRSIYMLRHDDPGWERVYVSIRAPRGGQRDPHELDRLHQAYYTGKLR